MSGIELGNHHFCQIILSILLTDIEHHFGAVDGFGFAVQDEREIVGFGLGAQDRIDVIQ